MINADSRVKCQAVQWTGDNIDEVREFTKTCANTLVIREH